MALIAFFRPFVTVYLDGHDDDKIAKEKIHSIEMQF